jgi:Signal peptidase (SPase) II
MRARLAIVALVATPLVCADLVVKAVLPTNFAFLHQRSGGWMVLSTVVLLVALLLARLPSRFLAAGAGVLAAGVLGNLVSAGLHHGVVPNPFVIVDSDWDIAFNLADLFVLSGIVLLTAGSLRLAVRHRDLLPESTITVRLIRRVRALLASG